MSEPQGSGTKPQPIQAAVNSTVALLFSRFVVPGLLGIIGWFIVQTLNDLKDSSKESTREFGKKIESIQNSFWNAQGILSKNQADISIKLGVLGEKVSNDSKRIDQLEINQYKTWPKP